LLKDGSCPVPIRAGALVEEALIKERKLVSTHHQRNYFLFIKKEKHGYMLRPQVGRPQDTEVHIIRSTTPKD
jgi:hypothetical protein